jgi:hypothetical protein
VRNQNQEEMENQDKATHEEAICKEVESQESSIRRKRFARNRIGKRQGQPT